MLTIKVKLSDGQESEALTKEQLAIVTPILTEKIPKTKFDKVVLERLAAAGLPAIFSANPVSPPHTFNNALKSVKRPK